MSGCPDVILAQGRPFGLFRRLPSTADAALQLPFVAPSGYGLWKSGRVRFAPVEDEISSIVQIEEWVEERHGARAFRQPVRVLDARG